MLSFNVQLCYLEHPFTLCQVDTEFAVIPDTILLTEYIYMWFPFTVSCFLSTGDCLNMSVRYIAKAI